MNRSRILPKIARKCPHLLCLTCAVLVILAYSSLESESSEGEDLKLPKFTDGLLDIFFVNGGRLTSSMKPGSVIDRTPPDYSSHLYLNRGNLKFTDVSEQSGIQGRGYGMGAAVGDYDNDGFPDLYVTNFGKNILYHNNGDGRFSDVTDSAGVAANSWSTSLDFHGQPFA
ncbi:MAG: VCBS repeat-containing protein [Acidobacteria bacterium]|nr:VCBS repeat-containing protein [Acidobacteriota bacterium]MCI0718823.1 VCBS repeat-containing protein [Acidobacteriota bacterium]